MNHPRTLRDGVLWVSMSYESYYMHLAHQVASDDPYDKSWLSSVTVGECAWAQSLGDEIAPGDDTEAGRDVVTRSRRIAAELGSSMHHQFAFDLRCTHCGVSWEEQQRLQVSCHRYKEPKCAPRERPEVRKARLERFDVLYPF